MHGAFLYAKTLPNRRCGKEWSQLMKLQWLKDIFGNVCTDEIDTKVDAALGECFVALTNFNEKTGKVKLMAAPRELPPQNQR